MANERRLIDVSELKKLVREVRKDAGHYRPIYDGFLSMIDRTPTAEAIIPVRCKDCIYHNGSACEFHSEFPDQYTPGYIAYIEPDDFLFVRTSFNVPYWRIS